MILQKEIRDKAIEWSVPPDTVDKDYVLGHFLSGFAHNFKEQLIFKGGTCLRKCYFPGYRFSEDLDFTSIKKRFELEEKQLREVCEKISVHSGIQFHFDTIEELRYKDDIKGYQIRIRYWGANHSRNQAPLPVDRWQTAIKLEISVDEILITKPEFKAIHHPYSDQFLSEEEIHCYSLHEITAEKIRSLKQRSYTAPRDYYDLYHLTDSLSGEDWRNLAGLVQQKMKHKQLSYSSAEELVSEKSIIQVLKAWDKSIAHQVSVNDEVNKQKVVQTVAERIKKYL
ncbi:MAG: nucleotidyl transferase AbiEii/AbiGii toxin family protein [Balneola sp.]